MSNNAHFVPDISISAQYFAKINKPDNSAKEDKNHSSVNWKEEGSGDFLGLFTTFLAGGGDGCKNTKHYISAWVLLPDSVIVQIWKVW